METCTKCGWKLPAGTEVCPYCGQPVESDEEKKRLKLRLATEEPLPPLSSPTPQKAASGTRSRKRTAIILTSALLTGLLLLGSLAIILWPRPQASTPALMITPSSLDFGSVTKGDKAILSVIITKSGSAKPVIESKEPWLKVTFRTQKSLQNNQYEMIYDVIADSGSLQPATHTAKLAIAADGGKPVLVNAQMQVIQQIAPAHLNVNPTLLDFGSLQVEDQKTLPLMVSNTGGQELRWTADKEKTPWLTLDHDSGKIAAGAAPQSINVMVDTTALTADHYSTTINFSSNGGNAAIVV